MDHIFADHFVITCTFVTCQKLLYIKQNVTLIDFSYYLHVRPHFGEVGQKW